MGWRFRHVVVIGCTLILISASLLTLGIVHAHPATRLPAIGLNPKQGPVGGQLTVTGYYFGANETVDISWIEHANNQQTPLGTAQTGATGSFQVTLATPATASFGPYTVVAIGQTSGDQATANYVVGDLTQCDNTDPCGAAAGSGWQALNAPCGFIGTNYLSATGSGDTFTWTPNLPFAGSYEVYARVIPASGNATNAPFTINYYGGQKTVYVNENTPPVDSAGTLWQDLGNYSFAAGNNGTIVTTDTGANGAVVADAVMLINGAVSVTGTVQGQNNQPVANTRIDLWNASNCAGASLVQSTSTDSNGHYTFSVPPSLSWFVQYYNGWNNQYNQNYVGYWATPQATINGDYQEPTFNIYYPEQNNLVPVGQNLPMPTPTFPTQFSWNSYPGATSYKFEILQEPLQWTPGANYQVYYTASDQDPRYKSLFQEPCKGNPQRICFTYPGGQTLGGGGPLPIGSYLWGAHFSNASGEGGVLYQPDNFNPRLINVSPSFAAPGQPVTLVGVGFDGTNLANDAVSFGTTPATVTAATSTTITATVPSGLSTCQQAPCTPIQVTATVTTTNDPNHGDQPEPLQSNAQMFTATPGTVTLLGKNQLRAPDGLALDGQNNVYVSNFQGGAIIQINQQTGKGLQIARLPSSTTTGPSGLAVGGTTLYMAEYAPTPNGAVYETQGSAPTIFASNLNNPALMATDSAGNLWVANYGAGGSQSQVLEYAPGGQLLQAIPIAGADAMAFDSAGNAYVAAYSSGTIWTFNPSNPQPVVYVQSPSLVTCDALAFDPSGNLWVTTYGAINKATGALYEITSQNGQLVPALFAQNFQNAAAIEFDSAGAMYLANTGERNVWKYVP